MGLLSDKQANPLWPVETRFPTLDEDLKVDIAIVGGGIAGISCGFHLHNSGYKVAIIEKDEVGSAATGASSGILYYGSGGNFVEAIQRYGRQDATSLWKETGKTIKEIVALVGKHGLRCGYRATGATMAAKNAAENIRIERERTELAGIGITTEQYTEQEVASIFKGRDFLSGLHFPICCVIHPAQFAAELAKTFNIPLYERSPMVKLSEEKGSVTIESTRARIQCDRVVLATNLEPLYGLEKHFAQETTVVLASQELQEISDVWPQDTVIWTMEEKYDILYPLGERMALELYEARNIRQKIAGYYGKVPFNSQYQWGDSWSKTKDLLPIAGHVSDRVFVAVAMGDEGIVMGFAVGKRMPLAIKRESDPILRMVSPTRFAEPV